MTVRAEDYKGKWFVLCDEISDDGYGHERKEINIEWVIGEGLREHVENCRYYGIPAYVGKDKALHKKITALNEEMDKSQI